MDVSSPARETGQHGGIPSLNNLLPVLRLVFPSHKTGDVVDPKLLRDVCLQGNMDKLPKWARAQAWKILLGYLPMEKKEWSSTLERRRGEYFVRVAY